MGEPGAGVEVTFTVKELLSKLEKKLDLIIGRLDSKVDLVTFQILEQRVNVVETKLSLGDNARRTAEDVARTLAEKNDADRTFWERRRVLVAWCLGALVGIAQIHYAFPHIHF